MSDEQRCVACTWDGVKLVNPCQRHAAIGLAHELRTLCVDECRNRIDYRCVVCRAADAMYQLAEERLANQGMADKIAHLRISEAGWLNEYKQSQKQLANVRAALDGLQQEHDGVLAMIGEEGSGPRYEELEAALREIDRLQRAEMYERCPDCDYPTECSRECGCRITERKGTAVQQVVWRTIGREAAEAGGERAE